MEIEAGAAFKARDLFQDTAGVAEAGKGFAAQDRSVHQLVEPLPQRPKGAQQVAAVNSGNIARLQRSQGPDIVPVQEMSFIALKTADGFHGAGQSLDDLVDGQVAGIMGAQCAGHPEADVGRTGAHGQAVLMGDLEVVGRQPRCVSVDECREIAPGPPGDLPEEAAVRFRQRAVPLLLRRAEVEKPAEQGGEKPEPEPGSCQHQARRHDPPDHHAGNDTEEAAQCQGGDEERLPAGGTPMGGLGSPLQQSATGDQAPVADPGNGIQGHCRLVRQQRGICGRPQQVVHHF